MSKLPTCLARFTGQVAPPNRSEMSAADEEALAALAGLTLWRAADAPPAEPVRPSSVFAKLPPLAWPLLVL